MPSQAQLRQRITAIILKAFNPSRVFIALMFAVILWLFPIVFPPKADAQPLYGGACGRTCNLGCCISGACSKCPEGDPDLPPTISGSVSCSQPGNSGWCIGALTLNLAASDPQGQPIIISGDVNGLAFACPAGNIACSVPITIEGNGAVNFIVNSDTGLSASGSTTYQLDLSTPQLDGDLSGANGTNNWFISDVIFSASAVDSISGLAALETSTDGGTWTAYNAPITLSDGIHTVALRAYDYAGNIAETNQTISIDTLTPVLDSSVSGAVGLNGWYVSDAQVSAAASDLGSGLFMLEVSTDGEAWTSYSTPVTLSDGVHTVQFRATDNAGNVTESTQTIKVDTITPTLSLSVSGTVGLNGWNTSITQVSSTSSDSGSGVAVIEGVADNGTWTPVNSLSLSDGLHTYQFKATDNAGNTITIPVQNLKVDTIAPIIDMTETLPLGEKVYYSLEDKGSGLSVYRAVIEDDAEKYKKIVWLENISGNKLEDEILWDGKFGDGRKADLGEYFITLKISDAAGNETMKSAVVKVTLLSTIQIIPPFTPPQASLTTEPAPVTQTESTLAAFGGTNNGATGEITSASFPSAGGVRAEGGAVSVHAWTKAPDSTTPAIPQSAILWGTAATALVGATLADWKRKRDEEERRAREQNQSNGPSSYTKIAKAYQASLDKFRAALVKGGYTAKAANALKSQAILNGIIPSAQKIIAERREKQIQANIAAYTQRKAAEEAARKAEEEKQRKAAEAQGLMAYYLGRKAGEVANTPPKEKKSVWGKAWDLAYKYQTELSLGTGIALGAAAALVVVAGVITAPAWLVVGGAVLATATLVTAGTVALNAHFGLGLGNKLGENLVAGIAATVITAGAGLLLANFAPFIGTTIATTCTNYATACAQVGTIIDKGEEALLAGQISYYNLIGDQDNAAQTAIELQLELMDGDAPGNTVAQELGEQINKLGPDALEIVEKYGDDAIPLLLKYGDDAVDIIGAYGNEGIALLLKFGDDAGDAINLVRRYGTSAVKVLDAVDPASADKLLKTLDPDVLDYAIKQDSDAVFALSRWSEKELMEFGPELALRAKKDAKVLKAINSLVSLGPIDPKRLTTEQKELIKIIAENSTQYADEGQIVLGKWVDYGNGFTSRARETGSVHYNPHPDMWNLLGTLGDEQRDTAAWLVNEKVIQTGIDKGLPFEYSLTGISMKDIDSEHVAIQSIFSGATDSEIKQILGLKYIPVRMKEIQELQKAGYETVFDEINNTYILSAP